jgi:glycosyltransferase involved in cell wall biosynthesis
MARHEEEIPRMRTLVANEILHILGTAQPEGTGMARMVGTLARGLDPQRFQLHAWFLAGDGPLVGMLEHAGVRASALDWRRGARDPAGAWRFWRRLRSRRFQIVQVHFGGRSVCWLSRAATRARIIRHLHGRILETRGLSPILSSARGADMVVAVSHAVANQVVDSPVRVIYAGVEAPPGDPAAWRHCDTSEIVLGTAGRLVELKGLEYLLRAAAALRHEFPTLRVEIAGSGPQRAKLEEELVEFGLGGRVEFLGWVDNLNTVLPRWDIFVMPSLEEGFPVAALDAMAVGLPVVATRVGGVPELIEDGKTGWLVPPRDVEALASRLRVLLCNPELRANVGAAAHAHVSTRFDAAHMAEDFAGLYDELLTEIGKGARNRTGSRI